MQDAGFVWMHRVTYAECTVGNHVYYARYLDWLEAARGELFRHLGRSFAQWQDEGVIFPVLEAHLRYRSAARYDEVLRIRVWPTLAEKVRLNFAYGITSETGKLVLEAETLHVCAGLDERPKRLPAELIALLAPQLAPVTTG